MSDPDKDRTFGPVCIKKEPFAADHHCIYGLLVWLNHGLGKVSALVLYALLGGFVWLNLMELNGGQEEDTGGEEPFQLMQVPNSYWERH